MNDNKLIAEFMEGGKEYEVDINTKTLKSYHTSWDWLMPVVKKCFDTRQLLLISNESFLTMDIDVVYDRVVEFIKTYNNGNARTS
tara:strand:+ start:1623 stop:1877 length:255 start_codon:yes stop_codon:yes gene_type:complete